MSKLTMFYKEGKILPRIYPVVGPKKLLLFFMIKIIKKTQYFNAT